MVEIIREPIDARRLRESFEDPADGASVLFEGIVRNHSGGRPVLRLEYEAYEEMAVAKLEEIRGRAIERFDVRDIAIVHRIGRLEIGESSVAVLVRSAHRAEAFDACRYVIDTLKSEVPIFKHEFYEDGDRWIEGAC